MARRVSQRTTTRGDSHQQPRASAAKRPAKSASERRTSHATAASPATEDSKSASQRIDERIAELTDWRGQTLARLRALILAVDPEISEEWKWRGTPVWSCQGIICTGESYHKVVKLTFAHGASLPDPTRLFNASLAGNTRRAIDVREGESLAPAALQSLVRAAVEDNRQRKLASLRKNTK